MPGIDAATTRAVDDEKQARSSYIELSTLCLVPGIDAPTTKLGRTRGSGDRVFVIAAEAKPLFSRSRAMVDGGEAAVAPVTPPAAFEAVGGDVPWLTKTKVFRLSLCAAGCVPLIQDGRVSAGAWSRH